MNDLHKMWQELLRSYTRDEQLMESLFSDIERSYSGKDRHYHNLQHIFTMLKGAEAMEERADDYDALRFAIWYHDIVYNSLKHDNEEKSADAAEEALSKLEYPPGKIAKVKHMILRTKKHMEKENDDIDTSILLDLDLSILGTGRERYKEYMQQVRDEYGWVPGIMYRQGRKKVLQMFLDAENIYRLDEFKQRFEAKARENLRYELDSF